MKTILYMAISVDGFISGKNHDTSWVSPNDWKMWKAVGDKCGNIVVGRKTYEAMLKAKELPLEGRQVVVLTRKKHKSTDNTIFTDKTPREVVDDLHKRGYQEIFIAGGGELNRSFLDTGVVNELYLTVEPIILGQGTKLFAEDCQNKDLELVETVILSKDEIQLRYKVKN